MRQRHWFESSGDFALRRGEPADFARIDADDCLTQFLLEYVYEFDDRVQWAWISENYEITFDRDTDGLSLPSQRAIRWRAEDAQAGSKPEWGWQPEFLVGA